MGIRSTNLIPKKKPKNINLNIDPEIFNDVYLPHLSNDRYTQIYFGGSSSGKSVFLCQRTVLDVMQGHNYLIVRKYGTSIKKSIFNEVQKAISFFGLNQFFNINESEKIITCTLNKKQILFSGLDDVEKLKSITPKNGVVTRILVEEATEIEREDYKQLTKRLRGQALVKKSIIFAFNPIYKHHWMYKEFFDGWDDTQNYYEDETKSILRTTYKDNRFLAQEDIDALENENDPYYYNVYTLGKFGIVGSVIFKNWTTKEFTQDEIDQFHNNKNGLDFGFSIDPTAFIRLHYDKKYKKIYIYDEFGTTEMTNDIIAQELKKLIGNEYVTCDSAEARSIQELRSYGVNALPTEKGKDSILHGIQWLQQHEIIISTKCTNTIREFNLYRWKQDKYGNTIMVPVDKDNHWIDALRYSLESEMKMGLADKARIRRRK